MDGFDFLDNDEIEFRDAAANASAAGRLRRNGNNLTWFGAAAGRIFYAGGTDVPVADGGTALSSGTDGGILGFTATGTIASSVLLAANGVVLGGGAGATPTATTAGSANQVLRVPGAGGAPAFGTVALNQAAAVTGALAVANGGTGLTALGTALQVLRTNAGATALEFAALAANFTLRGTQQTTELTTTSTTANQSLQTIGSLSIPTTSGLFITWRMRKTAGAASGSFQGIKINTTNGHATNSGFSWAGWASSTNQAEDAESWCFIPARGTDYSRGGLLFTSNGIANTLGTGTFASAALGTASITDVTIMGHSGDVAITTGCNFLTVYEVTGV